METLSHSSVSIQVLVIKGLSSDEDSKLQDAAACCEYTGH